MRKHGQITVFLSLILICICSLICGILESARTAGARCYLQTAANSSIQSVFSQYHRELWNQYRILGLEYKDEIQVENDFRQYLDQYLKAGQFYPMKTEEIRAEKLESMTDSDGKHLEQEILDYMKFGIWDTQMNAESVEETYRGMKEAVAIKEMSDSYSGNMREAMKLEQSLEAIMACLKEQKEYADQARNRLDDHDGSGYRRAASKLKAELSRIPGLVKTYEKRADQLGIALEKTKQDLLARQESLSDLSLTSFQEEMAHYEAYTAKDGERRLEVKELVPSAEKNLRVVEETAEAALEVEAYIDDWEDSDDEDGHDLDEDALWDPVIQRFAQYQVLRLSCTAGVKDKESQGILEQIGRLVDLSLLDLVLPQGAEVSEAVLSLTDSPSSLYISQDDGSGGLQGGIQSLVNRVMVNEYGAKVFNHYLSPEKPGIQYELEYLAAGEITDHDNLKSAVSQILMVREGMNLLHIFSDSAKREEANMLATAIVGATGIVPLVFIIACFIMCVWALGEAVMDVRGLLDGQKVPLIKTSADWSLSLSGLLELGKGNSSPIEVQKTEGTDYEGYLKLILFIKDHTKKLYQMMDLMQMELKLDQPGFLMSSCAYSVDIIAKVCGKHIFLTPGLLKSTPGKPDIEYRVSVKTQKAY